jgi:magnesium chelatase family protein
MLAKVFGSALHGVEAFRVSVEVSVSNGLGYTVTGQPDEVVRESLSRAEVAIKGLGLHMPRTKLSVNLSPAHIRKTGAGFDLPITLGILLASGQLIDRRQLSNYVVVGELGLDGSILPVKGALCMASQARTDGMKGIIVPVANASEARLVEGIDVLEAASLKELLEFISGRKNMEGKKVETLHATTPSQEDDLDFRDVRGQDAVKRAMEIAAAGGHNILLFGPPGVGKTMLARRLPTILPPMTNAEMLETTLIHSLDNGPAPLTDLVTRRPFRNPHHTASDVVLTGGGSIPQPGEISLAHNGVLFLDELYEFKRSAIEILRQPMEQGKVRIDRAKTSLEFPASFMLVAAMNPCFCGYLGHPTRTCTCSKRALEYYLRKTSGPLMDRIDLQVTVESVPLTELMAAHQPVESSAVIRARVIKARAIQSERFKDLTAIHCNARMPEQSLDQYCLLDTHARRYLFGRLDSALVSARSYSRILKVSRTIADLAGSSTVEVDHVAEAVHFRGLERLVEGRKKGKGDHERPTPYSHRTGISLNSTQSTFPGVVGSQY